MALQLYSHAEQVASHLRADLLRGRWSGTLPGILSLGKELGLNHNSVDAALRMLEAEGLLVAQGHGRPRRVALPRNEVKARPLRIKIFLYEGENRGLNGIAQLLARLQGEGFIADFATKSLHDLGMQVERVARFVEKTPADAWVIMAGSREVLEWFANEPVPALAMFGRFNGLPIAAAAPQKKPALVSAVRRLIELGHHRIVMLTREERRKPQPGRIEQVILDELAAHGIPPGPYNLPDWDEHPAGLQARLESLFRLTPPSALIIDAPDFFYATQQYLARQRILVPEQVSLLCNDPDPIFNWSVPAISHIAWDYHPIVQRVLRWANNVALGKDDRRQSWLNAKFVEGGTIGPAPR